MRLRADLEISLEVQACAMCGADRFETLTTQDRHGLGLATVGCASCGLVQTNPRPDAAGLASFYSRHYRQYYQGVADPSAQYIAEHRKDDRLRYTADHLAKVFDLAAGRFVLDYGCGEGSLFVALRQSGFRGRLAGVETNASFATYAAKYGQAEVHPKLDAFGNIDLVLMNHVLEHLLDPIGTLKEVRSKLNADGWLYIDVPDAARYESVSDLHLAHVLHFTRRTLTRLVQTAGFDVVACETHDPPHHPRSIRLRARPRHGATGTDITPTSPATEADAWAILRRAETRKWRWAIRRRLAGVRALRATYRLIRRWSDWPADSLRGRSGQAKRQGTK